MKNKFIIYGAGFFGRQIKNILEKNNCEVLYFIDKDKDKIGTYIDNTLCISINDTKLTENFKAGTTCLIGIFNDKVNLWDIEKMLFNSGFLQIINPIKFYQDFSDNMYGIDDYFWLTKNKMKPEHKEIIENIGKIWSDDYSRKLFNKILEYRQTGKLDILPRPNEYNEQYCPKDIDLNLINVNLIDCGAYNGDSIYKISKNFNLVSVVAFEASPINFISLSEFVHKTDINCFLFPCAVWDKLEILRFNNNSSRSSSNHIDMNADSFATAISIDESLLNYPANYIKMDIEGAELNALNGAEKLIKKYKPVLAISVYHKYNHLYEIPYLIKSWNLGYKLYLRIYAYNASDIICYAVPDKLS